MTTWSKASGASAYGASKAAMVQVIDWNDPYFGSWPVPSGDRRQLFPGVRCGAAIRQLVEEVRLSPAVILRDWVPHGAETRGRGCNGRPNNSLILHQCKSWLRPENHGVGGSIPPLGTTGSIFHDISLS